MRLVGARVARDPAKIAVRQQSLRKRAKGDSADSFFSQHIEQPVFNPARKHGVLWLMNQAGRAQCPQDLRGNRGLRRIVIRNSRIKRVAGTHSLVQCAHGFFNGRVGVRTMRVEDIDILQAHALQTLVKARQQVLARTPRPIRSGPHVVAGLRADDQLVPIGFQIEPQHLAEVGLRAARRRPVIVGKVEVCDPEIEGAAHHGASVFKRIHATEVVPEPERDKRQLQAALARAAIRHGVVTLFVGDIHDLSLALARFQRLCF